MLEERQRELEREEDEKVDMEQLMKEAQQQNSKELEHYIRAETKKTISALQRYISLTQGQGQGLEEQSTDDGADDESQSRPTRSFLPSSLQQHNISVLSGRIEEIDSEPSLALAPPAPATPTSSSFVASRSMRGNALKSLPKRGGGGSKRLPGFMQGRSGSLSKEPYATFRAEQPYQELTPIASAGVPSSQKSPHLELVEKQLSQERLFLTTLEAPLNSLVRAGRDDKAASRYQDSATETEEKLTNSHVPATLLGLPAIRPRKASKSRNAYLGLTSKSNQSKLQQLGGGGRFATHD